jgi:hypothetical protein
MPLGTAAWLVKNTQLQDKQIAEFCQISLREVIDLRDKKIEICPVDPINYTQQLTEEEIKLSTQDKNRKLQPISFDFQKDQLFDKINIKEKSYCPLKLRKKKKNAVLMILKTYPMITNKEINQLMNISTKTVEQYRQELSDYIKNFTFDDDLELYFNMNPLWKTIKNKYNLNQDN